MAINMDGTTYDSVDEFFEVMDGMYERGMMKIDDMPDPDKFREYLAEKNAEEEAYPAETTNPKSFKLAGDDGDYAVGDVAVVTNGGGLFEIGDEVTIKELEGDGSPWAERNSDGKKHFVNIARLERVSKAVEKTEFEVGDKVRLTDNQDPVSVHAEIGAVGDIVGESPFSKRPSVDFSGCTQNHSQIADPSQLELVKPIAQDANGEDLYVGDLVTGLNDSVYPYLMRITGTVENPKASPIFDLDVELVEVNGGYMTKGSELFAYSGLTVKTTEEEYDKKHNPVIEVGSKVIALSPLIDFTEGNVYEVVRIDRDNDIEIIDDEGDRSLLNHKYNGEAFRLATDEEIADADRVCTAPDPDDGFKVGDKAVITEQGRMFAKGTVVTVSRLEGDGSPLVSSEGAEWYVHVTAMRPVEDTKDFQDGDIVYVNEEFTDAIGDIAKKGLAEMVKVSSGNTYIKQSHVSGVGVLFSYSTGGGTNEDKLTLVCRAEDRLDTEKF